MSAETNAYVYKGQRVRFIRFGLTGPAHFFVEFPSGERRNVRASECKRVRS